MPTRGSLSVPSKSNSRTSYGVFMELSLNQLIDYPAHPIANMNCTGSYYRRVHARVIFVEAHDRFHDARIFCGRVWIEVDHYAPQINHRNVHGRRLITVTKHQGPTDPFILEKGLAAL